MDTITTLRFVKEKLNEHQAALNTLWQLLNEGDLYFGSLSEDGPPIPPVLEDAMISIEDARDNTTVAKVMLNRLIIKMETEVKKDKDI